MTTESGQYSRCFCKIYKVQRVENKLYKVLGAFYTVETLKIPVVRNMTRGALPKLKKKKKNLFTLQNILLPFCAW